jgi:hypothetical protein
LLTSPAGLKWNKLDYQTTAIELQNCSTTNPNMYKKQYRTGDFRWS